jgi:hypothetical protein
LRKGAARGKHQMEKSFLLLFFKKEALPFLIILVLPFSLTRWLHSPTALHHGGERL